MLLYLCSNQNIDLFDFLESSDYEIPIKKMSGMFILKQFVIHDVRNLKQFSYFVIDLKALKDTEDKIIEAISAFESMYSSRVIIFAEGLEGNSTLLSRLVEMKIYNIITSSDYEGIKQEMIECISPEGKDLKSVLKNKYFLNDEKDSKALTFLCKDIKIAVVGVERRTGTTTVAFHLTSFLSQSGTDVSYVEANTHGHLSALPSFFKDMIVHESFIEYKKVKYYLNGYFPEENNFTVIDFGALAECNISVLKQCDLVLLCGTAKSYEIEGIKKGLESLDKGNARLVLLHVPSNLHGIIENMFNPFKVPVHFYEYSPVMFDGSSNSTLFKLLIKDYITEINDK